jgi:hypothetical protein
MNKLTEGQRIQNAYRNLINQFSQYLQIAVTLTLKQTANIKCNENFNYRKNLNDETLQSTIKRFTALLTWELYGNQSRHKNKRENSKPLIITVVEGRNTQKLVHLHLAIGNIPLKHLPNIEKIIEIAWTRCDFANEQIEVVELFNSQGWLGYITKQVGYTDNEAWDVCSSTIPQFIELSI